MSACPPCTVAVTENGDERCTECGRVTTTMVVPLIAFTTMQRARGESPDSCAVDLDVHVFEVGRRHCLCGAREART